jgi:hypothetical protein
MNSGKPSAPPPERWQENEMPEAYLAYAKWFLANSAVLEVWGLISSLPEIGTPQTTVTLDAGTWFLCRMALPPIPEGEAIISFVPHSGRAQLDGKGGA